MLTILQRVRSRPYAPWQLPSAGAIAAAAAAVAVAAVAGWALAARLTSSPAVAPQAAPSTVRLGGAEIALRAGWRAQEKVPPVPGLQGVPARAFGPADDGSGRMIVALLPPAASDALPAATAAALQTPVSVATRAAVGGLRGVGYPALSLRGVAGLVDVYSFPTAAGRLTVACVAPVGDPLPVGTCPGDIVSVAARAPVADPLAAPRARLPAIVRTLDRARRIDRAALRRGATSSAQARDARRLAGAYAAAARASAAPALGTGPAAALARVFAAASAAYSRLATAAAHHDRRAWARARHGVHRAELETRTRLDAVRAG